MITRSSPRLSAYLSPWWLWALLSLPAAAMAWDLATSHSPRIYHVMVQPSGEWSVRLLLLSLMATPLLMLFSRARLFRWLVRNRRYFGVAAFAYAALHTLFYVVDMGTLRRIAHQATRFDIATGWLAFVIFLPLAATSMDYAVRRMGRSWKTLQRWVYAAAVLTFLHWAAVNDWHDPMEAVGYFAPLAVLSAYRLWRLWRSWRSGRQRPPNPAAATQ